MSLTSLEFLLLLPCVCVLYYMLPVKVKYWYLLFIDLLFYSTFGIPYLAVVFGEALITWRIGIGLAKRTKEHGGKSTISSTRLLVVGILLLVTLLAFFKLGGLYSTSVVAPIGISFYTMQAISYMVDVFRGKGKAESNFFQLLLWLSFFPTITSGPIFRYRDFGRQFKQNMISLRADYMRITNGIIYMIYGYFLKLVIAERAAIPVNFVYADLDMEKYSGLTLFVVACLYSLQLYADFAGYSAIVIGIAQILGFDIPENFRAPYLSCTIKEFWGRWHVSFSKWLKDYVYIPLGGNRKGRLRKYGNLMVTFLISGVWHGVGGWHFLVWGGIHGIYQVLGDLLHDSVRGLLPHIGIKEDTAFHRLMQRVVTFMMVTAAWVYFRTGLKDAVQYIWRTLSLIRIPIWSWPKVIGEELLSACLSPFMWSLLAIAVLFMLMWDVLYYKKRVRIDQALEQQGSLPKCLMVIVMLLVILIWGIYGDQHDASYFVYSQF